MYKIADAEIRDDFSDDLDDSLIIDEFQVCMFQVDLLISIQPDPDASGLPTVLLLWTPDEWTLPSFWMKTSVVNHNQSFASVVSHNF